MNFQRFQERVHQLSQAAWPDDRHQPSVVINSKLTSLLAEESGELARAVRKLSGRRIGHDEQPGSQLDVAEELGDVLFVLARIANHHGLGLEGAAFVVLEKIQDRTTAIGDINTVSGTVTGRLSAPVEANVPRRRPRRPAEGPPVNNGPGNWMQAENTQIRPVHATYATYPMPPSPATPEELDALYAPRKLTPLSESSFLDRYRELDAMYSRMMYKAGSAEPVDGPNKPEGDCE